jgi:16S rRNA (cytidine1402-2'-O)-methyltransferase
MLLLLMEDLPLKKAAAITSQLTGLGRNQLYELGLELKKS